MLEVLLDNASPVAEVVLMSGLSTFGPLPIDKVPEIWTVSRVNGTCCGLHAPPPPLLSFINVNSFSLAPPLSLCLSLSLSLSPTD